MKINSETKGVAIVLLILGFVCIGLSLLPGCALGPNNDAQSPTGSAVVASSPLPSPEVNSAPSASPSAQPSPTAVQQAVLEENEYREAVGQEPLTAGLDCYLYTVPQTTTAIVGATGLVGVGGFTYHGVFNQPVASVTTGFNVLPLELQGIYQTWFIVKCTGDLVVTDNQYHEFDLSSDDGSNLYIDGLLISNDGLHATQTKSNAKFLKYGFHSFELDFFQGGGQQSLLLNEDGALMESSGFYH